MTFDPDFPLTLPFRCHQLSLVMGRHTRPHSSVGLGGFSFIPKLKSGLFSFQKVLCKLAVGSGHEDSHGNIKNNSSVLRAAHNGGKKTVLLGMSLPEHSAGRNWAAPAGFSGRVVGDCGRKDPFHPVNCSVVRWGEDRQQTQGIPWASPQVSLQAPWHTFSSLMWPPGTQPGHASSNTAATYSPLAGLPLRLAPQEGIYS